MLSDTATKNIIATDNGRWRIYDPDGTRRVVDKLPEEVLAAASLFGAGSADRCKACGKTKEWHTKEGGGPRKMRVKHKFQPLCERT